VPVDDSVRAHKGDTILCLNSIMKFVATGEDTNNGFAITEALHTAASDPPPHVHEHEDEAVYVLEGRMEATIGGITLSAGQGELIFLPRGVPHSLHTASDESRVLYLITPAGFENYFAELGEKVAAGSALPEPTAPDVERIIRTAAKYGCTILPPS